MTRLKLPVPTGGIGGGKRWAGRVRGEGMRATFGLGAVNLKVDYLLLVTFDLRDIKTIFCRVFTCHWTGINGAWSRHPARYCRGRSALCHCVRVRLSKVRGLGLGEGVRFRSALVKEMRNC